MAHILPAGAHAPTSQESTEPAAVPIAWESAVDPEFVAELNARAEWFMNALVEMSLQQQARKYRRKKTAMTIDQSGVKAGAVLARWKRDPKTGKEIPQKNALDTTTDRPEARRVRAMEADWDEEEGREEAQRR